MNAIGSLTPLALSPAATAPLEQKKEADEYSLLVLKNLHDSLKWVFTILMGGSAILAGRSLISWADFVYAKYAHITIPTSADTPSELEASFTFFLFLIYALTLFRFYWGWLRYCDIKYLEVPSLIVAFRQKFFDQKIAETYEAALQTAVEYSRLPRVLLDTIPIFFQTTVIFVLAGSLNSLEIFIYTYIFLLLFNSIYLALNYRLPAYHQIALTKAFGSDLAAAVTPRNRIQVWIVNNLLCAVLMWGLLHEHDSAPSIMPQAACVFVMFANCLIDLRFARQMYSRRVRILRDAVGRF